MQVQTVQFNNYQSIRFINVNSNLIFNLEDIQAISRKSLCEYYESRADFVQQFESNLSFLIEQDIIDSNWSTIMVTLDYAFSCSELIGDFIISHCLPR